MTCVSDLLPRVYQNFLPERLLHFSISETKATCSNCLRSRDHRFSYLYKPHLKCCTFFPFLPNYAVGGVLAENTKSSAKPLSKSLSNSAADILKHNIFKKRFALPLGVFPDLKYQYRFQNKKQNDFGRKEDLLCPYYLKQTQQCGIWQFRGTVCTTYYCRSDYGAQGLRYWQSLNDFLSYLEMALAEECLVLQDFSPRDISDQLVFLNKKEFSEAETKKERLTHTEFKRYWNGYTYPEHFYLTCYEIVQNIRPQQFKEMLGDKGRELLKKVMDQSQLVV